MKTLEKARPSTGAVRAVGSSLVEQRLSEILKDLALVLVASGYGVGGLNRLIRRAYLDAALSLECAEDTKKSYARIAALTGLTRAEVSQLLRQKEATHKAANIIPFNRAQRVSHGWLNDDRFRNRNRRPRVLPFAGRRGSFEALVKAYSGDIPARAMLSEMVRLRMVRVASRDTVHLVRTDPPVSRKTDTALRAISPWVRFLAEDMDASANTNASTVQITLGFDSLPTLFSAVRELQSRAQAFVNSVFELGDKGREKKKHKLHVSIGLATRIPNLTTQPKRNS